MKRLVLNEMVWTEVSEELENIKLAVVPVGSCEQHGPNTTFETDTARSYEFCKLLGNRMGNRILICPPVTIGLSTHHMDFPGTITLRVETLTNVLADVAIAISKHGIKKILFVNGHGGNRTALDATIIKLKYEYNIDAYWSGMGTPIAKEAITKEMDIPKVIGHGCEIETSQSMYLAPWVVKEERFPGELHTNSAYFRKIFKDGNAPWNWKRDASENGALGDARKATKELGKQMTDAVLDYMEGLVNEIINL